jgi:hypothetical protein
VQAPGPAAAVVRDWDQAGGSLARRTPATALPSGPLSASVVIEVERLVGGGCVGIIGRQSSAGIHLAGQRVTLRIDAKLLHVITADGMLTRRLPPTACGRLHGPG